MRETILVASGVFIGAGILLAILVSPIAIIAPFGFGLMLMGIASIDRKVSK